MDNYYYMFVEYVQTSTYWVLARDFAFLYTFLILVLNIIVFVSDLTALKWRFVPFAFIRRSRDFLLFKTRYSKDWYPTIIPKGENREKKFYDIFSNVLRRAEVEIYNSGDGFNMTSIRERGGKDSSREKADILDGAIIEAIEKNDQFVYKRFQILSACNLNWISRLIYMKGEYKAKFQVFFNKDFDHIGCFCAIDVDKKHCVFEWQLVSGRKGLNSTISKGYCFVYENKELCNVGKDMFDEIEAHERTNRLNNKKLLGDIGDGGLSVDGLRQLQEHLWNERVKGIQINSSLDAVDPEINEAFIARGVDKTDFKLEEMAFIKEDWPEIGYPSIEPNI